MHFDLVVRLKNNWIVMMQSGLNLHLKWQPEIKIFSFT
jgi:hypothetical protein